MAPPTATETVTNTVTMQAPQSSQAAGAERTNIKMQLPSVPVFEDKVEEREYLKGRLAAAFRIFGDKGYDEGMLLLHFTSLPAELPTNQIINRCCWTHYRARSSGSLDILGESIRHRV